ncbi:MAG: pseudouridine synthase [Kiloniellales bacterium]|nr:pseudouridine synthase [Kiloniellales bacterium]
MTAKAEAQRIAKVIARSGLCSRRDAELLIAEGRVSLDGRVLDSPAVTVRPGQKIRVDDQPLPAPAPARLWRYHKPAGLLTAAKDPEGRPTIYDSLPKDLPRLQPVGRLDLNSEGLLLLTNDGELKRELELPASGWQRRYRVRAYGRVSEARLEGLRDGVTVEGVRYGPIKAKIERASGANLWLSIILTEGKNREVRRVLAHLGLKVNRLIRVGYGPFTLGSLARGAVSEVPAKRLREALEGPKTPRAGWAKAKPKASRPGRKPQAGTKPAPKRGTKPGPKSGPKMGPKPGGKPPAARAKARPSTGNRAKPSKSEGQRGAHRRRPA